MQKIIREQLSFTLETRCTYFRGTAVSTSVWPSLCCVTIASLQPQDHEISGRTPIDELFLQLSRSNLIASITSASMKRDTLSTVSRACYHSKQKSARRLKLLQLYRGFPCYMLQIIHRLYQSHLRTKIFSIGFLLISRVVNCAIQSDVRILIWWYLFHVLFMCARIRNFIRISPLK